MVGIFVEIEKNKAFTAVVMALVLEDHTSTTLAHKLARSQGLCGRQLKILERKGWVKKKDPRFSVYTLNKEIIMTKSIELQKEYISSHDEQISNLDKRIFNWLDYCRTDFPSSEQPSKEKVKRYKDLVKKARLLLKKAEKEISQRPTSSLEISKKVAMEYMRDKTWLLTDKTINKFIKDSLFDSVPSAKELRRLIRMSSLS